MNEHIDKRRIEIWLDQYYYLRTDFMLRHKMATNQPSAEDYFHNKELILDNLIRDILEADKLKIENKLLGKAKRAIAPKDDVYDFDLYQQNPYEKKIQS